MDSAAADCRRPDAVDLFEQAKKALTERSPFDAEESVSRVSTLPALWSAVYLKPYDGRKKHKKSHGESSTKGSGWPKISSVWEETEAYFRPVTIGDIDELGTRRKFGEESVDSCLFVPLVGGGNVGKCDGLDAVAAELSSGLVQKAEEIVESERELEVMNTDEIGVSVNADLLPENGGVDDGLSLHWVLGCRERFVLTSERPNKKHKLLGRDAGLDRLLLLPKLEMEGVICDFCCLGVSKLKSNRLLCCENCKVYVHQKCYGVSEEGLEGAWICSWCKNSETAEDTKKKGMDLKPCLLCPKDGGALKALKKDFRMNQSGYSQNFLHLFCGLWIPEIYVEDTCAMEPVMILGDFQDARKNPTCSLCKVKHGVTVRCSHGTCRASFHPICARQSKLHIEIWGKLGCQNVELRVFCSRHSVRDTNNTIDAKNLVPAAAACDESLVAKVISSPEVIPVKKIPKLRFTHKNKDKNMMQDDYLHDSGSIMKEDASSVQKPFVGGQSSEGGKIEQIPVMGAYGFAESMDVKRNALDFPLILRKLIDRGTIRADDVALEMGIPSDSLQAALTGETTSVSPGLRLKIIKWLQSSAHIPPILASKEKTGVTPSYDAKDANIGESGFAKEMDSDVVYDDGKLINTEAVDSVQLNQSTSTQRTMKGNIRKVEKALDSSEATINSLNDNGGVLDRAGEMPIVINENKKGDTSDKGCATVGQNHASGENETPEMTNEASFRHSSSGTPLGGNKGETTNMDANNLSDTQRKPQDMVGRIPSSILDKNQADVPINFRSNGLEKACLSNSGFTVDLLGSRNSDNKMGKSGATNYIHPLIKKLLQTLCHIGTKLSFQPKRFNDPHESLKFSEEDAKLCSPSSNQQGLALPCSNANCLSGIEKLDHLARAKSTGVLGLSPDDEVEGEIVYLQAMLLGRTVAAKHIYEELILKVVRNLPEELNTLAKRKWDLALVSQFLRGVREANKRGRKERRHKEAQAILAAAAAAAAASSRNTSIRKDVNDQTISANYVDPLKVSSSFGAAGVHSPLTSRTKESSRSSNAKLSADKLGLVFQIPDYCKENGLSCEICMRSETILNRIFVCSTCKVSVHLDCYRSVANPVGPWKCEFCEEMTLHSQNTRSETDGRETLCPPRRCSLCGTASGALRKSVDGQWIHALCAEWLLESRFKRGQENLVEVMDSVSMEKDTCCICLHDVGACLRCSFGNCQLTFHPSCAKAAGFYMNANGNGGSWQHKAYCNKHSLEQRELEQKQFGDEHLKNLRMIRVELERLRLLCERIIKREKLKRDLVLCSHEILSSRRDSAAFSLLVRSSFFHPGISSESATTSLDNKSYSASAQRSDDITVDSTVSGKRTIRFTMPSKDLDRITDDSSNSHLSVKRKVSDRTSSTGKHLPQRSTSITFRNSTEDDEKNHKATKHMETFQKELMMISDEASMQNQRLPKGFAYVPVASLSKEKQDIADMDETQEPGG